MVTEPKQEARKQQKHSVFHKSRSHPEKMTANGARGQRSGCWFVVFFCSF